MTNAAGYLLWSSMVGAPLLVAGVIGGRHWANGRPHILVPAFLSVVGFTALCQFACWAYMEYDVMRALGSAGFAVLLSWIYYPLPFMFVAWLTRVMIVLRRRRQGEVIPPLTARMTPREILVLKIAGWAIVGYVLLIIFWVVAIEYNAVPAGRAN